MSSPKIRDTYIKASTGWFVNDPDTKTLIHSNSYRNLRGLLEQHRISNSLPTENIDQIIHEQVCAREPESYCQEWPASVHNFIKEQVEPSIPITETLKNFAGAIAFWVKMGFPVVSEQQYRQRIETCRSCNYWDEKASLGMGKCNKCGCTRLKQQLGTSKCPINKW